ncbi:SAM-dependent methyltransferase [Amycolatopsis antarctica]|uniref:SAM-dependent methyltransferase n=1 Tax=Amycolatopsis antarctica TaxID=1854586 RepID=A0A263D4V7_9PSEU|nr:class I SAM-dependent methyltransferase [Amycolatopsis antarctica]OZM72637.1 SAM-dependent methyltransferase [Amycolatopsis antarctica]
MYGAELAQVYDQSYRGRGKDYTAEAAGVLDLVRDRRGEPASLLDIACGTGAHLRAFAGACAHVEGLELSADMLAVAKAELPGVPLHQGDMRDFRLDGRFDAVTCMFSSIGHMADQAELDAAVRSMATHLTADGVLVIEPWWFPERFLPGYVAGDVVRVGERTISRVSHSTLDGGASRVEVHYTVAEPAGIRSFVDVHRITLFGRAAYESAFTSAGCAVEYVEGGPSGRGLFVGTAA